MAIRGVHGAPYWRAVWLIRTALAFRPYLNGRLLQLGITEADIDAADMLDLIEALLADGGATGALRAHVEIGKAIDNEVALTPDRAVWGMDLDDPAWAAVSPAAPPVGQ